MSKILIVGDITANALRIGQELSSAGLYNICFHANDGREGLKIIQYRENIDIVIMDHHLPHMDGIEALKKMRKSNRAMQIFMTSEQCGSCQNRVCLEHQADGFLIKPIKVTELLTSLSKSAN